MNKMGFNRKEAIKKIESKQLKKDLPDFAPSDEVIVHLLINEGAKTRIQKIAGVVIRKRGSGLNETFMLRKISGGVGVEINFQTHSPLINEIEVVSKGKVRRAYLTYLRNRSGRDARIKPLNGSTGKDDDMLETEK
ncbi:50S ribosomal protein L19 [bacterium]|nr:50S ribosomal protein L19 [bacterium]MBP5783112.1 50S ribosomal protein L19 [bacterium]